MDVTQTAGRLITRTDPTIDPLPCDGTLRVDDLVRAQQITAMHAAAPDAETLLTALGIEGAFLQQHALQSIAHADPASLRQFIAAGPTPAAQHLRRNSLAAASLALAALGQAPARHLTGLLDLPPVVCRSDKVSHSARQPGRPTPAQQRAATSDEVLVVRLAVDVVDPVHDGAVGTAVALASGGATQAEVPAARVRDVSTTGPYVQLGGRHGHNPHSPHYLPQRWAHADAWSWTQIAAARQRLAGDPDASLAYRGRQALSSQSARTYCAKNVEKAIAAAGLEDVWGLTTGSLALWRMLHTLHHDGPDTAEKRFGAQTLRTLNKLAHQAQAMQSA